MKYNIIILALVVVCGISIRSCINHKQSANELHEAIRDKEAQIKHWKDENGKAHATINEVQGSLSTVKALYALQVKQITSELNIKDKQLNQFLAIASTNQGNFQSDIDTVYANTTDTIKVIDYLATEYADDWLKFHGKIKDGKFTAEYSMKDSIQVVGYWKRKGFLNLGKKDFFIDVSSANPNVTINSIKNFRITSAKQNKIGVGIIGGYGLSLNQPSFTPFIGIGVFYRIF